MVHQILHRVSKGIGAVIAVMIGLGVAHLSYVHNSADTGVVFPVLVLNSAQAQVIPCVPPFCVPPPPPPPPPPDPTPEPKKPEKPKQESRSRDSAGRWVKVVVCVSGSVIAHVGKPVPLKHMSKRQWKRYRYEVRRHKWAQIEWGLGCGIQGPVLGAGLIAGHDFADRFIRHKIPIKRTKRQEEMLFCRDGSAPCPDLTDPDPDQYGPK